MAAVSWDAVNVGDRLPSLHFGLTYRKVIMTPGVTLDYFPGHFDPEYARSLGHPTIFLNTMPLFGLVDRIVTEWAGPSTFVVRHKIKLRVPVYAGDHVTVAGCVAGKSVGDGARLGQHLVQVEVTLTKDDGPTLCCEGTVLAALDTHLDFCVDLL
jgi:acyl dehydratase